MPESRSGGWRVELPKCGGMRIWPVSKCVPTRKTNRNFKPHFVAAVSGYIFIAQQPESDHEMSVIFYVCIINAKSLRNRYEMSTPQFRVRFIPVYELLRDSSRFGV